jgi:hypothetical protein
MRILAVDPGKTTGWAFVDTVRKHSFAADQAGMMEFLDMAEHVLSKGKVDVVVVEDFVITMKTLKKTQGELWSLEQLGILRWLCYVHGVEFARPQTASDGKSFGTDHKLRAAGWFASTTGGHRNDACRHLLKYLADHELQFFLTLIGSAREEVGSGNG